MKFKKCTLFLISLFPMLFGLCISSSAAEPSFYVTKSTVTVTDAPENSDVVVAVYNGERMVGVKMYHGSGTVKAQYGNDMKENLSNADNIKVFLWNMAAIEPLTTAFCEKISNLPDDVPEEAPNRVLTVYFSCTGNTEALAQKITDVTSSDVYEIIPKVPYTSADLNYNDSNSRANREQNDATARPAISGSIENFEDYDVIILGYPIWWGTMPKIINTFLESYDFSGKTIMPFCTSGSSGISTSVSAIRNTCPNSVVTAGFRGTSSTTNTQIQNWLNNNGFSDAVFKRMKLTVNGNRIIIKLNNNNTAKDLADMLPVELDFSDYNNTEKIAYLPQSLNTSDTTSGIAPTAGDLTLYVPWGNLALFYKDFRYSADLISIGSVEEGLDYMTELEGKIMAELY